MFKLIKLSGEGFEMEFDTESEMFVELDAWICDDCYSEFIKDNGYIPLTVEDLIWTSCGAEFLAEGCTDEPVFDYVTRSDH